MRRKCFGEPQRLAHLLHATISVSRLLVSLSSHPSVSHILIRIYFISHQSDSLSLVFRMTILRMACGVLRPSHLVGCAGMRLSSLLGLRRLHALPTFAVEKGAGRPIPPMGRDWNSPTRRTRYLTMRLDSQFPDETSGAWQSISVYLRSCRSS